MKVIAIAGQLNSGKDVLADFLVDRLNHRVLRDNPRLGECLVPSLFEISIALWNRSAFANAVKEVYEKTFAVDREFIEAWKRNPEPPPGFDKNVRQSLQFIGDGFRSIKDGIWIEIALRNERKKLIISDSRYNNEARAIKAKGGVMVVLYRPGFLNDDPNPSEAQIGNVIRWCVQTGQVDGPINRDVPPDSYDECGVTREAMDNYDLFIVNDGTVEDLYGKVDEIIVPYIANKYTQQERKKR